MKEKVEKLTKKEQKIVLDLINDLVDTISPYIGTGIWRQSGKVQSGISILTKGLDNDFDCLGKSYFMERVEEYTKDTAKMLQLIKKNEEECRNRVNNHCKK